MKNNNLLIIIIIVAVILLIVMISALMKGLNITSKSGVEVVVDKIVNNTGISKEDEEKINKYPIYMENKYTNSLTVEQQKRIIDIIDEVLENLNKREYSSLYSKLSFDYKGSEFPTEAVFKDYLDATLLDATDYTCTYYDAKYHGYECLITSKSQGNSFRIKIDTVENFTDYELVLRTDLVSVEERNAVFYVNGLNCKIIYEEKCTDTLEFIIVMENSTKNTITTSFVGSDVEVNYRGNDRKYSLISPNTEVTFKPKEEKKVRFIFDIKGTVTPRPSQMNILAKTGENEYHSRVGIDFSNVENSI